jgi:hypothetical protein
LQDTVNRLTIEILEYDLVIKKIKEKIWIDKK